MPKDIVIQSWRGQDSLAAAAKQGYRGILSNGYYLDLGWTAARHYAVDPMSGAAANLTPRRKSAILGGESCMWSEYVNPENIDSRIWPRNAAIAERLWSPQSVTDAASMYTRMEAVSERLELLGLTHKTYYRAMLQRIAGPAVARGIRRAQNTRQRRRAGERLHAGEAAPAEPTSATPLNRLVDAVPLESETARHFGELVDKFVAATCHDPAADARLREQLTAWRDNDARLQPLAQRSFLVKEVCASSQDLSTLGSRGSRRSMFRKDQRHPPIGRAIQTAAITQIQKPKAQLLLMPATAIQKLVEAASAGGSCAK